MQKHNYSVRDRQKFGNANAPVFHEMVMEAGIFVTTLLAFLRGALVVSGGTVNGTSLGDNPGGLVQTFEVDAQAVGGNPGGKLKNLTSRSVLWRRLFDYGTYMGDLSQGTFNGAAATYTFNSLFELPFALPRALRPFDTALCLDYYDQVRLKITNGGRDTQFSGNDRTFDYSGLYYDIVDYREMAGGQKPSILYEDDRPIIIKAANARTPVKNEIPADGYFVDLLWLAQTDNSALADTIINKIQLFSGSESITDLENDHIKADQKRYITDAAQATTGVYYTPISPSLLAGAMGSISAMLDVSHPGTNDQVTLAARRIHPPAA